jgi:hypothetical protein
MSVVPSGHGSTTLNTQITSYDALVTRVLHQIGAPLVNIEVANEQIYDLIDNAIEYFTKWAGYTEEYLVFKSTKYQSGIGLDVGTMVNDTPEMYSTLTDGVSADYDKDLGSLRRVIDCFEFNYGETTGINTLFTLEQAMAQQIYSSYMIGNFGFDLTSWETLKEFIKVRDIVLAQRPRFRFDARTQLLKIIPEPIPQQQYIGVVGCYIERPIKDLIKERWVHKYTLALTKLAVAHTRGKYNGTTLFGGGSVNFADLMRQGEAERDKLEEELKTEYIDAQPIGFYHG